MRQKCRSTGVELKDLYNLLLCKQNELRCGPEPAPSFLERLRSLPIIGWMFDYGDIFFICLCATVCAVSAVVQALILLSR